MLPNFIGIGAQRAGSTWLYACLREHPQVFVPPQKELHFFNAHFDRGLSWYEQQFAPANDGTYRAVGEITPGYLDHGLAISRIAALIPEAKLFVVLREPAQRAYSAYKLFSDRYRDWSFIQACQRGQDLVRLGCYAQHLTRVFKHIPRKQVKIFLYEDLVDDPQTCLADLLRFLSVDPDFVPKNMTQRYNRVVYPRAQALLARWRMSWAVDAVKKTPIAAWIRNQNPSRDQPAETPVIDQEMASVRAMFYDDVRQLQTLINRDLSSWLE